MSLAAGRVVVAFRLPDLADVLAFFVAFRLPDLAAGRVVVAFRLPDLADVLAFFVAFRLPDLAAGRVVAFRLPDLAAGRVVAFRLPDLADVPAFFVAFRLADLAAEPACFLAVVLAIDCPFRSRLSRGSVRLAQGGLLAVVAQCPHPAAQLNAPRPGPAGPARNVSNNLGVEPQHRLPAYASHLLEVQCSLSERQIGGPAGRKLHMSWFLVGDTGIEPVTPAV
jgi:hypothetical protein